MAITSKGSYYANEGPELPTPPGYSDVNPHAAKVSQQIFHAPSGDNGDGVGAVSHGIAGVSDLAAPASA